jgi:glycogen operon protein
LHGHHQPAPGIWDIAWYDTKGELVTEQDWKNPEMRLLCLRRTTLNADQTVSLLSLLMNPSSDDHFFDLPKPVVPCRVLVDSARPDVGELETKENRVSVLAHSVVLCYALLGHPTQ